MEQVALELVSVLQKQSNLQKDIIEQLQKQIHISEEIEKDRSNEEAYARFNESLAAAVALRAKDREYDIKANELRKKLMADK